MHATGSKHRPCTQILKSSDHILPNIKTLLDEGRAVVERITQALHLSNDLRALDRLSRPFSSILVCGFTHSTVIGDPKLKQVFPEALRLLSIFHSEVSHNHALYEAFKLILADEAHIDRSTKADPLRVPML